MDGYDEDANGGRTGKSYGAQSNIYFVLGICVALHFSLSPVCTTLMGGGCLFPSWGKNERVLLSPRTRSGLRK